MTTLRKMDIAAMALSAVVLLLVVLMRYVKFEFQLDVSALPAFHALLNSVTAVLLVVALIQVKRKNITAHKRAIYLAIFCSVIFLLSYVVYHFLTPSTKYGGEGISKVIYLVLLLTHIVLAAVSLPLILLTFNRAYTNEIEKHRRFAKFVFPIWLYVAVSGPVCYLMLMPYYK